MMEPGVEETLVATKYSLATLEVGEASHCENLTIFPLFAREEDRPEPKRRYELLTDAIAEESAQVAEHAMDLGSESPAMDFVAGFAASEGRLESYRKKLRLPKGAVEEFVAKLADNLVVAESQPGLGVEMEVAENAELAGCPLAGSALWYDGAVVHLAAFGTG